jgi:magnesium-transporting ATPase (P-type)
VSGSGGGLVVFLVSNDFPCLFLLAERVSRTSTSLFSKKDKNSGRSGKSSKSATEIALIVDGLSLEGLWAAEDLRAKFIDVVQNVPTVIACRVSPLQKAALVRMVKAAPGNPVTLGIGDGANDVGMIHESRVGIGISGREGRHAANAADFAVAQFKFVIPLLFEHGRFNYIRCSKLVLYSFFKNLLLVSMLFYYQAYVGFSGTIPLDSIVFSGYNFYLGLPILVIGAMDFDVPRKDVYKFPLVAYSTGRLGEMLNIKNMAKWCIFAFIQGLLLFTITIRFISGTTYIGTNDGYFSFDIYGTGLNNTWNGSALGIYAEGFVLYTVAVVAMQYKVVSMAITPNYLFWLVWVLSFAGYFLFTAVYGLFPMVDWYLAMPEAMGHPVFWLAVFLVPFTLVLSNSIFDFIMAQVDPSSQDELVEKLKFYYLAHPDEDPNRGNGGKSGMVSHSEAGSPIHHKNNEAGGEKGNSSGNDQRDRLSSNPRSSGGVALRAISQTSSLSHTNTSNTNSLTGSGNKNATNGNGIDGADAVHNPVNSTNQNN